MYLFVIRKSRKNCKKWLIWGRFIPKNGKKSKKMRFSCIFFGFFLHISKKSITFAPDFKTNTNFNPGGNGLQAAREL